MRLRFSIAAIAGVVLLAALVCRLLAPSWQFEGLINGEQDVSLTQLRVNGQRRLVVCEDPEVLRYLRQMMVFSRAAQYSDGSGDSCTYYSMTFQMNGGMSYRVWNCYLRDSRTGVGLIGDEDLGDGWPSLDVEFRKPAPKNFDAILDFLLNYDAGIYHKLHCRLDGEIVVTSYTPK